TLPLLKYVAVFVAEVEQNDAGALITTGWPAMVYIASVVPAQPVSSVAVTRSVTAPLPSAWKVIASVLAPLTIVPLTMDHWNDAYGDAPGTTCAVSVAF